MGNRHATGRGAGRWLGQRAFAASILVTGLLLFTWPFVRTPPLDLASSYVHLLGAWVAVVIALAAMANALDDPGGGAGDA